MIYDSMFTDQEYGCRVGWGHSTWQEALRVAEQAEVGTCVLFHHDPDHSDAFMDEVAGKAAARRPGTVVAREGLVLRP
jgi:ribonuclease BN (tRNA processing enzyme)